VPCKPLTSLMADAGMGDGATLLSLDVEGAEDVVLANVDPRLFAIVVVEQDHLNPAKNARVRKRLENAGLVKHDLGAYVHSSDIYMREMAALPRPVPVPASLLAPRPKSLGPQCASADCCRQHPRACQRGGSRW
jgi:hypothetical protein